MAAGGRWRAIIACCVSVLADVGSAANSQASYTGNLAEHLVAKSRTDEQPQTSESELSPARKDSLRRLGLARAFLEHVIQQQLGDVDAFGPTDVRIHWRAGEVVQVDISPARSYK